MTPCTTPDHPHKIAALEGDIDTLNEEKRNLAGALDTIRRIAKEVRLDSKRYRWYQLGAEERDAIQAIESIAYRALRGGSD